MTPGVAALALLLFWVTCGVLRASSFQDDFVVVFIDASSEAKHGPFPLDRSILARGIRKAHDLHARGVVLKFFMDLPRVAAGDRLFAQSLTNLPVLLQASVDGGEAHPNPLPERCFLSGMKARTAVAGRNGLIPLPMFATNALDIGFVNFSATEVPLLETYQERTVKSLFICAIELATGKRAVIEPGSRITFGSLQLPMDARNCIQTKLPPKDELSYVPFEKLLAGEIPEKQIHGKVVILGYDGPQIHSFPTSIGQIRAHRLFVHALQNVYGQLETVP